MDHSSRSLEDSRAERCVEGGGTAQEVVEGNNIGNQARDHSCDTLAKYLAVFCPSPKNLPEAKLLSNGLIYLKEISKQSNIGSLA